MAGRGLRVPFVWRVKQADGDAVSSAKEGVDLTQLHGWFLNQPAQSMVLLLNQGALASERRQ